MEKSRVTFDVSCNPTKTVVTINLLEFIHMMDIDVTYSFALTGHDNYGSPYDTCDDCGNCSGAKCDYCNKHTEYHLRRSKIKGFENFYKILESVCGNEVYLPDHETLFKWYSDLNEKISNAEQEIVFSFLAEEFRFLNFDISDIESYRNDLLEFVYVVKGKDDDKVIMSTKEDAKYLASMFDSWSYVDLKINIPGRAIFKLTAV